ncbi:ATP-binding mismatch repair protein [Ophidiomyces ophidiicola]|uniref:ATP-binding mismatch repair protein n=1 Tax=Ophidiomyces ophidiicola TaxID=1387563 RepID=UPI0020C2D3D5|nr:ATP-binding mismatch repair protein [Ophidiomyces ophidiicola]KAI1943226.1 ATP-binding mismatch repair protein [Ophidiomyces ophidiicola]KAI2060659.1 ATP-binding mismatch repair protein [Ophidiomyces ophidiicola]
MATIKAIEARSVHQIQSGQVIVDLCSVVKELVENSLDAGSSSIDIRFKNNGLDLIEVQDNGDGISPKDYENIALKHYTSKLSTFEDLSSLETFGFRGEALSSLCGLSRLHIVTAQATQAPKARRLEFEISGKLKSTQVVAGQKGTTVSIEGLFERLPVRRRTLEKNIKREYGKVLGLLHAYACISTGVRFSVKNLMPKGKSVVVFATKSNPTTKENIANVYGAKTLLALIPLDLELEFQPSVCSRALHQEHPENLNKIFVHGYISKPIFGEGRQTPDRQMFFVNSRPCGLPQIARAFNEVYRSFNISQSPFIFANFEMDTRAYDVNVSPDKRTILLHDAGALIESLKATLTEMFESQEQTVPQSHLLGKQGTAKQIANGSFTSALTHLRAGNIPLTPKEDIQNGQGADTSICRTENVTIRSSRDEGPSMSNLSHSIEVRASMSRNINDADDLFVSAASPPSSVQDLSEVHQEFPSTCHETSKISSLSSQRSPNIIQNAFDRMRPTRPAAETATITIGGKTVTSTIGYTSPRKRKGRQEDSISAPLSKRRTRATFAKSKLGQTLKSFSAPTTQAGRPSQSDNSEETDNGYTSSEDEEQADLSDASDITYVTVDNGSDSASLDEIDAGDREQKAMDEQKIVELIQAAEDAAQVPSEYTTERANKISKRSRGNDATVELMCSIDGALAKIKAQLKSLEDSLRSFQGHKESDISVAEANQELESPEAKLSLTVSKRDFGKMRIVGQFNLGFILAVREGYAKSNQENEGLHLVEDELFIIDQHASDEKYNFERLQAETVVQNQRLVKPKTLDLTAVEEEVILDNIPLLEKNGFLFDIDESGDEPIGRRCKLVSLPLSKEVVFNTQDLEELIALLSESPHHDRISQLVDYDDISKSSPFASRYVPRPSKVRKMFAMRACRSSIMVGNTLTIKQMEKVVRHMGLIDKPWNCPHGRPTMRHLVSLGGWQEWSEWPEMEITDSGDDSCSLGSNECGVWRRFLEEYGHLE